MSDEEESQRRLFRKIRAANDCRYDPTNPLDRMLGPRFGFKPQDPDAPADYMICMAYTVGTPFILPDNVSSGCVAKCGRLVQHRPSAPVHIPKLCIYCAAAMTEGH